MKKILFAAFLVAGTTLGFAKDNVQNPSSTNTEASVVKSIVEKNQTIYQFSSIEEAQKFLADCTDVTAAYAVIEVSDGNGGTTSELTLVSMCETTYPCVSGGTRIFTVFL